MKTLFLLLGLISFNASATAKLVCKAEGHTIVLQSSSSDVVRASYGKESVEADGLVSHDIVDIVAKFSSIGEITILAKVGVVSGENYMFIQGKRISVLCR